MVKALADRFAEAYAEYLHKEIRINKWGYDKGEKLDNKDLIKELLDLMQIFKLDYTNTFIALNNNDLKKYTSNISE